MHIFYFMHLPNAPFLLKRESKHDNALFAVRRAPLPLCSSPSAVRRCRCAIGRPRCAVAAALLAVRRAPLRSSPSAVRRRRCALRRPRCAVTGPVCCSRCVAGSLLALRCWRAVRCSRCVAGSLLALRCWRAVRCSRCAAGVTVRCSRCAAGA